MALKIRNDTTGLDAVDPSTHPSRDARHFRAIRAAVNDVEASQEALQEAVDQARAAGDPWSMIGAALGLSRQAAQQRFGH